MTDDQRPDFDQAFQRVISHYRLKMRAGEATELARTYFRLLEAHPLDLVVTAGVSWMARQRKFPKAVDWLDLIETGKGPSAPADARRMSVSECDQYDAAERLCFEDQPCGCAECCRAGVDDLPTRLVPTLLDGEGDERAYNPRRERMQIVGHWCHGAELRRWYDARDAFYALAATFPKVLQLVVNREPGQEG